MREENPLVSIIVRTKDRPKLLKKALQSIAAQTYRPIEVVLINDGGCDLDVEEIRGILGDAHLNYIRLEKNTGRAHAGNVGIENAKGEYIGFLDDDDRFYSDHVSILVSLLEKYDYRIAYTDAHIAFLEFDPESKEMVTTEKRVFSSKDFCYGDLIMDNYIPLICILFSKIVLRDVKGFDESFDIYEDWDFLIRIAEKYPFYHVKKTTSEYIQWSATLQIAQTPGFVDKARTAHGQIISKHKEKFTIDIIRALVQDRRIIHKLTDENEHLKNIIQEREADIANLEGAISQKEEQISNLEGAISQKEEQISNLEGAISQKEEQISNLEGAISQKEEQISNLETTLHQIYDSRGWKILEQYYKMRERLFPLNSKRRLFYEVVLVAFSNPKGTLKSLNTHNLKKFLKQRKILESSVLESKIKRKISFHSSKAMHTSQGITLKDEVAFNGIDHYVPLQEKNHILVIDRFVPTYDRDSGSLRMYSLLKILNELGYKITFLPDDLQKREPYVGDLQRLGIEVVYGNLDVEAYLRRRGRVFTIVLLSRPEQAFKYLSLIRASAIHSLVIYDTVDLHCLRFERAAALNGDKELATKAQYFKSMEFFNASCSDVVFTVSGEEKEYLLKEIPELWVEVIPNIHDVKKTVTPFSKRSDIMFIGSFFHQPNEDAVFFFVREIFPLIKEKLPHIKFYVVGSDPSSALLQLNSEDIRVTGYVKDVTFYFETCRVFVSPLRYGAGMKGKIGQSMGYGLPVVTTTIGAEGIGLVNAESALIADKPEEFADAITRLYTDEDLWNKISSKSIEHIEQNYSKEVISKKISELFHAFVYQNNHYG